MLETLRKDRIDVLTRILKLMTSEVCLCKGLFTQAIFVAATRCNFCRAKARLHRRFLSRQLDAIFVALKLQLQNRTGKPGAIFIAICRRDIAGFRTCLKLVATLTRQKLHRVAATKIASVNGPLQS